MRKCLGLLMLVPFAAILVLSCDDHPTVPEEVQAATTVQESSTPQATKAPPLPTPVVLSGWEHELSGFVSVTPGSAVGLSAACESGKIPLSGGFIVGNDAEYVIVQNSMFVNASYEVGWRVAVKNVGTAPFQFATVAACVDGTTIYD